MEWVVLSIITALCLGIILTLSKRKMYDHESIEYATSLRVYIALLTLPMVVFFFSELKTITYAEMFLIYIGSLINVVAHWLTFKSVKHIDISKISPFLNLEVVFIAILAYVFFNESLSSLKIIGIAILFLSTISIEYITKLNFRAFIKNFSFTKYFLTILLATFYYAVFKILSRHILYYQQTSFIDFFILLNVFNALNGILITCIVERISPVYFFTRLLVKDEIAYLVSVLTYIQIFAGYLAYVFAPQVAYVSAIIMLYVVFAVLLSRIVLKEKYPLLTYVFIIIAFLGSAIIIMG